MSARLDRIRATIADDPVTGASVLRDTFDVADVAWLIECADALCKIVDADKAVRGAFYVHDDVALVVARERFEAAVATAYPVCGRDG